MNSPESNMPDPQREKEAPPIIKKLDWDSEFFGLNIASIDTGNESPDFESIENFIRENRIELVEACCQISDKDLINKLEGEGYNFQDLRITYSIDLNGVPSKKEGVAFAEEKDIPELKEIAAKVFFEDSRFNHEKIDEEKVKNFYQTWVEKAVSGTFDDFCIVSKEKEDIAGFITGKFQEDGVAKIGLVAVAGQHQGKGVGKALMAAFFNHCQDNKISKVEVVTEGKNLKASNFYIRNGYGLKSIESWYYKTY